VEEGGRRISRLEGKLEEGVLLEEGHEPQELSRVTNDEKQRGYFFGLRLFDVGAEVNDERTYAEKKRRQVQHVREGKEELL